MQTLSEKYQVQFHEDDEHVLLIIGKYKDNISTETIALLLAEHGVAEREDISIRNARVATEGAVWVDGRIIKMRTKTRQRAAILWEKKK